LARAATRQMAVPRVTNTRPVENTLPESGTEGVGHEWTETK
jgi:hypothetical protein